MAGREFAEIRGEQMHAARRLRIVTGALCLLVLVPAIALVRPAGAPQPKPLVVRVDEVGRAEAVTYEAMEARADPLDPTTGYFLHRFVADHYARRRATVEEHFSRSLWFLTAAAANAAYTVAQPALGLAAEELQVENVQVRIEPQPEEPHGAAATFAALGWTGRDAEWLALICLHSGGLPAGAVPLLLWSDVPGNRPAVPEALRWNRG